MLWLSRMHLPNRPDPRPMVMDTWAAMFDLIVHLLLRTVQWHLGMSE